MCESFIKTESVLLEIWHGFHHLSFSWQCPKSWVKKKKKDPGGLVIFNFYFTRNFFLKALLIHKFGIVDWNLLYTTNKLFLYTKTVWIRGHFSSIKYPLLISPTPLIKITHIFKFGIMAEDIFKIKIFCLTDIKALAMFNDG